MLDAGRQVMV